MKIININSDYLLTSAQQSFAESVILCGEEEACKDHDSISVLMNEIPIFLLNKKSMPPMENPVKGESEKPATELLGLYTKKKLGYGSDIPAIYLCPENIRDTVTTEDELLFLIAKVIIHEFAHAKMSPDANAGYGYFDEFYRWMEEPMANLITLQYFEKSQECQSWLRQGKESGKLFLTKYQTSTPFDFVKDFIKRQPDNYKLGLAFYNSSITEWKIWREHKSQLGANTTKVYEKRHWIKYAQKNVLNCDPLILKELFNSLIYDTKIVEKV